MIRKDYYSKKGNLKDRVKKIIMKSPLHKHFVLKYRRKADDLYVRCIALEYDLLYKEQDETTRASLQEAIKYLKHFTHSIK